MYRIFSVLSFLIRQFVLPNPFESFAGQEITLWGTKIIIEPIAANWISGIILFPISYFVAGLFYKREMEMPALGSFLYFAFYCLHTFIIYVFCKLSFSTVPCTIILLVYIAILIFVKQKLKSLRYKSVTF